MTEFARPSGIGGDFPAPPVHVEQLQLLALSATTAGIVIADATREGLPIVFSNRAFDQMMELDDAGGAGGSFVSILLSNGLKDLETLRNAISTRTPYEFDFSTGEHEESSCWYRCAISGFASDSDQVDYVVGSLTNVTEPHLRAERVRTETGLLEKRLEERGEAIERMNQDLEGFTFSVSHDLRAPLRAIMGFSKVLVEDFGSEVDVEMRQTLDRINGAANRMASIIEELLTFSRLGRKDIVRRKINLSEMAEAIGADLIRRNPERDTVIECDQGATAEGDPTLIRMALENLIDNAYKFTSKTPHGYIEFRKLDDHRFMVKDNGAGFDPEFSDKLWRPFERLHSNSEFPGTGIGLANVRRIIERHGGEVWAESTPNQGAQFYFEL